MKYVFCMNDSYSEVYLSNGFCVLIPIFLNGQELLETIFLDISLKNDWRHISTKSFRKSQDSFQADSRRIFKSWVLKFSQFYEIQLKIYDIFSCMHLLKSEKSVCYWNRRIKRINVKPYLLLKKDARRYLHWQIWMYQPFNYVIVLNRKVFRIAWEKKHESNSIWLRFE